MGNRRNNVQCLQLLCIVFIFNFRTLIDLQNPEHIYRIRKKQKKIVYQPFGIYLNYLLHINSRPLGKRVIEVFIRKSD